MAYTVVETQAQLAQAADYLNDCLLFGGGGVVAFDCEGVPERLDLMQIATEDKTYLFDCVALGVTI